MANTAVIPNEVRNLFFLSCVLAKRKIVQRAATVPVETVAACNNSGFFSGGSHFSRTSANSGQFFFETGSDGGNPSRSKFLYCPCCIMRKSRCGPVESPVLP